MQSSSSVRGLENQQCRLGVPAAATHQAASARSVRHRGVALRANSCIAAAKLWR